MVYDRFINNAIDFCLTTSKGYSSPNDIIKCLSTKDNMLHSKFRYSLARDIAKYLLASFSDHIIAIRLYGSTMEYTAGIYSDIDMILHVRHINREFAEALKSLNSMLSEKYYLLLEKNQDEWSYLIDIHIINDDPKEKRSTSYAYLEHILHYESVEIS